MQKPASADDIKTSRSIVATAKDIGGEFKDRGVRALKDRLFKMLPGRDKAEPEDDGEQK